MNFPSGRMLLRVVVLPVIESKVAGTRDALNFLSALNALTEFICRAWKELEDTELKVKPTWD